MSDFNEEQRKENWNQIEIQVLLKEYEVLRAEILQLMQNSSNAFNYGITGLAAIWTAGALIVSSKTLSGDTLSPPQLKMLSFLVALVAPSVIAFSCRLWLLDTKSVIRIGKYIQWLEDKIQDLSGKKLLEWERCLHRKNYEPYQLQKETENQFKLKKWKEDYFQSFSFFRSHLFTVLYLYVITVAIALFVLLKYK